MINQRTSRHYHKSMIQTPLKSRSLFTSASSYSDLRIKPRVNPNITQFQLSVLYRARCEDLNIPMVPDQQNRFLRTKFPNRVLKLKELGLGKQSSLVLSKILSTAYLGSIELGKNHLGDTGSLAIAKAIRDNINVYHLDLSSNDISAEGISKVLEVLQNHEGLVSLNLSSSLNTYRNKCSTADSIMRFLMTSKVITHLNISGTLLENKVLPQLSAGIRESKTLLSLNLSNNLITSQSEDLFLAISDSSISNLNMSCNRLGDIGGEHAASTLSSNYCVLEKLDLSRCSIGAKGINHIFDNLIKNAKLIYLNLEGNKVKKSICPSFIKFLRSNTGVKTLNLSSCELGNENMQALRIGLPTCFALSSLNLAYNCINEQGADLLGQGLAKNRSLKHLNLKANNMKCGGCRRISSYLEFNQSLVSLNLADNSIKNPGGKSLLTLVKSNTILTKLVLEGNMIDNLYMDLLQSITKTNYEAKLKREIPFIRQKISSMRNRYKCLESVQQGLHMKQKEQIAQSKKLKNQINKLKDIKSQETHKFEFLSTNYKEIKDRSSAMSKELHQLLQAYKMLDSQFASEVKKLTDKISWVLREVKSLDKKKMIAKSDLSIKEMNKQYTLDKLQEEYKNTENTLNVEKIKLQALKDKKNTLEHKTRLKSKSKPSLI